MEILTSVLLLLTFVILLLVWYMKKQRLNLPGPDGSFFMGNLSLMDLEKLHIHLSDMADKYGNVFKIRLVLKEFVIVSGVDSIYEMLVKKSEDFGDRPDAPRATYIIGAKEIALSDISPKWSVWKKTAMKCLKQVGEDVKSLEELTMELTNNLTSKLESELQLTSSDIHSVFSDIIYSLIYGKKLSLTEQREFKEILNDYLVKSSPSNKYAILDLLPFMWNPLFPQFRDIRNFKNRMQTIFSGHLNVARQKHRSNEVSCAVDAYLNLAVSDVNVMTENDLNAIALVLVFTGTITTSVATNALLTLLAKHQDIQDEAHAEITKVIGHRPPTLKDRSAIPYVESMVLEVLRYISHAPLSLPHKTNKDTTLGGYEIPKGTEVWPNIWHLHHDKKLWDEPWKFKPRRFLDSEGNLLPPDHKLRKQLFLFGAGRRVCAGEVMARNRMFLVVTSLIQKLRFFIPEGEAIDTDPRNFSLGFVLMPKDYTLTVAPRN